MENKSNHINNNYSYTLKSLINDYKELSKFTLSFTVVFTSVVCFLLAPDHNNFTNPFVSSILLFLFGFLVTASSNSINQILEKDTDKLMLRTANRPLSSGRMSVQHATIFGWVTGVTGILGMYFYFNTLAALLSALSLILYGFVYTPLKRKNSIAVLVGAIPGALPCLIGWVAATNEFTAGGWIFFAIQFVWQFPHFWAIAWLTHQDYTNAGFKLLPSTDGPTRFSAMQSVIFSLLLLPVGILPFFYKLTGMWSMVVVTLCNMWMVAASLLLLIKMERKWARLVMFSSYFYLLIVWLALLANKINI